MGFLHLIVITAHLLVRWSILQNYCIVWVRKRKHFSGQQSEMDTFRVGKDSHTFFFRIGLPMFKMPCEKEKKLFLKL